MFRSFIIAALSMLPGLAQAHVGLGDTSGFSHGLVHPFSGLDHLLVMVAVGVLAVQLGGRALWLLPCTFLGMMIFGGALGMAHVDLPYVEIAIGLSVVVFGLLVAFDMNLPVIVATMLAGLFAIFHGHAHGAEMPASASGLSYGLGFVIATAILHGAGLALGMTLGSMGLAQRRLVRIAGGAMSLAGIAILGGAL